MRAPLLCSVLSLTLPLAAGCGDQGATPGASASASAAKAPPPKSSATAAATASAAPASSAPLPPRSDCPKDSAGAGTPEQPCLGKGTARLVEAKWTGKIDDEKGPYFTVTNKATLPVLYGKIAVYFYDKAGKQLEAKDATGKAIPYLVCAGTNLFSGALKVAEKATLTFSCVKKASVPEGATAIEGELVMVGFPDAAEKKSEFFWSNPDLAPDARPKGGVK